MSKSREDRLAEGCAVFLIKLIGLVGSSFIYGWIAYLVFDAFFSHDFSVWPFIGSVALIYAFLNLARKENKPLGLSASDNR